MIGLLTYIVFPGFYEFLMKRRRGVAVFGYSADYWKPDIGLELEGH